MALRKKNLIRIILLTLILFTIFSSFQIQYGVSSSSQTYSIHKDIIYDTSSINFNSTFNVGNQTQFTNLYNATYSFTGETGLTDTSISFIDTETSYDGGTEVIPSLNEHDEVLQFQDDITNGENPISNHDIPQARFGEIEFWLSTTDAVNEYWNIQLYESATLIERLRLTGGFIDYTSDAPAWIQIQAFSDDLWYHIRIVWRADDTWDCYINTILVVDDQNTENDQGVGQGVNRFNLYAGGDSADFLYIDGFGEQSDSEYYIGKNLLPTINYTDTLEVAKDEFNFDEYGIQYELGAIGESNYVNNWLVSSDPYNDITIIESPEGFDRELQFYSDTVHFRQIQKDISLTTDGFLNMSMTINYLEMNNADSNLWWGMYNGSTTEVALIRIILTGGNIELERMDYDRGGYTNLMTLNNSVNLIRKFSMLINEQNTVYLRYQDNSNVDVRFMFPKVYGNVNVYSKMVFISRMNDEATTQTTHIDSMALTINGTTQNYVNDYSIYLSDMNITNWNSLEHNIVEINGTGTFSFGTYSNYQFSSPKGFYNYSGYKLWNIYDTPFDYSNPYLAFISNESVIVNGAIIHGVRLNDGSNDYFLKFDYSNVDIDESYFYADTSNRLRYRLIINDNYSEFIEAYFNIPDLESENRSVSFTSNINGQAQGYFRMNYTDDTSSFIPFPTWLSTSNVILPQTKEIDNIGILITDNDNNDNGFCSGLVYGIQIIYYLDLSTTILTLNLMMVIVPIIVLLVPTFGIASRYGKNTILPMFILMSIICVATELIPVWLFFIIALSCGSFLFMKRERGSI